MIWGAFLERRRLFLGYQRGRFQPFANLVVARLVMEISSEIFLEPDERVNIGLSLSMIVRFGYTDLSPSS
jgi:hypothetical protein